MVNWFGQLLAEITSPTQVTVKPLHPVGQAGVL
jgi:hypothetical protein